MNKKAQTAMGIGAIIVTFIAVVVGVIIFQAVAQQAGTSTSLATLTNSTATAAANGESFYLTDYKYLSVDSITNGTTGDTIAAGNYTVTNNVVYNGALSVQITVDSDEYESETWAINGEAQPLTYASESGTRAIISLIAIFFALVVAIIALRPVLESKMLDMIGK